jgi:hypothetical protein
MDKKIAGLAGALAIAAVTPGEAATPEQPLSRANAYAELLKPIPNAAAELKAAEAAELEKAAAEQAAPRTQLAQYWGYDGYYYHHHHHHHHDGYWRRRRYYYYYHHHHHHHHHHHWWGY